jgi:hypothetical protein
MRPEQSSFSRKQTVQHTAVSDIQLLGVIKIMTIFRKLLYHIISYHTVFRDRRRVNWYSLTDVPPIRQ